MTQIADLPFLDINGPAYGGDPWSVMRGARSQGRVFRSDRGVELLDYDAARPLLSDRRVEVLSAGDWVGNGAGPLLAQFMTDGKMTSLSGEKHKRLRRMLGSPFKLGTVQAQAGLYRKVANELVDQFIERGSCDLVADFTHRYPIIVLCRAVGVPVQDIQVFERATLELALTNEVPLAPVADRLETALQELWDYASVLLETRERDPADDFVSEIALRKRNGECTHAELVWGFVNLLFGAHDTTRYQTASIVRAMLEQDTWDTIAVDPSLVPAAVEEGMRLYPVILVITRRVIASGVSIDGVDLPEGTVIRFNMTGATRDPDRFPEPDTFDLQREIGVRVPFGYGLHKCLGHTMARADMEIAIEVLTQRLRNPRLDGQLVTKATGALWGVDQLPLAFDAVETSAGVS